MSSSVFHAPALSSEPAVEFWRDPALPFFEGRRAVGSVSCYAPHTHTSFSIGIVDAGTSVFSLPQQETQTQTHILPGDVVLIAAGEVHSCNPTDRSSWGYRMFHIDQDWLRTLLQENGLSALPASQVMRSTRACALMNEVSAVMCSDDDALQKETVLISALCELFVEWTSTGAQSHSQRGSQQGSQRDSQHDPQRDPQRDMPDLQSVRDHLLAHCCDKIAIDTLARLAGIGRYQLIRQFRTQFGMTPHALQLDMRINVARDFLKRGLPLADVAYRTGFADQSHFHRIFKSRVAATPAQYQLAV